MRRDFLLIPVGTVPTAVCDWLLDALPPVFDCTCRVAPELPNPAFAWNARREQYLADAVLAQVAMGKATRALAIADLDFMCKS